MRLILFLCIMALFGVAGCSPSAGVNRTGKYLHTIDLNYKGLPVAHVSQIEWVELKSDGTYSARNGRLRASGRYTIQANTIRFKQAPQLTFTGRFRTSGRHRDEVLELDVPCFGIGLSSSLSSPEDYFARAQK